MSTEASEHSISTWRERDLTSEYSGRDLRPVEVLLLLRHQDAFSGRVLEVGCGGGRVLGYLSELSDEVYGIDVSPRMVEHTQALYPKAHVGLGDLRDLGTYPPGRLDVILLTYNMLDIVDPDERERLLTGLRDKLSPTGLLIFSSHNRGAHETMPWVAKPEGALRERLHEARRLARRLLDTSPYWTMQAIRKLPLRARNQRRLGPQQRETEGYALINDPVHDYGQLLYYIDRDAQQRQLERLGWELLECLDLDGHSVAPGGRSQSPELHYVTRPAS